MKVPQQYTWTFWGTATGQGWTSEYGIRQDLFWLARQGHIDFYVDYDPYPFRVYWCRLERRAPPAQPPDEMMA